MKKYYILLALLLVSASGAKAQKVGYVDMEYITGLMPEFKLAQDEMKKFSEKWAREIQDKFSEIDKMQRDLMAEEVLLTDDLKRKRQADIAAKEKEAGEYNSKIFGMEGLIFQKKKELMKPVMERVQRAVLKVSNQRRIDFMFDKSSDVGIIYSNPRHDYSDYVIEELGLNKKAEEGAKAVDTKPVTAAPQTKPKKN